MAKVERRGHEQIKREAQRQSGITSSHIEVRPVSKETRERFRTFAKRVNGGNNAQLQE